MKEYIEHLNKAITELKFGQEPRNLYEPLEYIMSLGGKRMRPAATLMTYHLYQEDWQSIINPALAVEVFHNFSLIHDDIMDVAPIRRGKPTVHERWNTNTAILSGDVMLVAAYELLGDVKDQYFKRAFFRFNRTAAEVCEGQQLDMNFEEREVVKAEEYLNMIKLKTSVLLAYAMELGGLLAGVDENEQQKLNKIGLNYGLGFQVQDDILDVFGEQAKVGKQVGGDIIENKKTWLLIKALERSENTEAGKELRKWIAATDFEKEEKVAAVRSIYNDLDIKKDAEQLMSDYFDKGFETVQSLTCSDEKKEMLVGLGQYLLKRQS